MGIMIVDEDAGATTTDPIDDDTDNGGVSDGDEDNGAGGGIAFNGLIDGTETDPNNPSDDIQPPIANFIYIPLNSTTSNNISFTDTSTDNGVIVNWIWDFDDGNISYVQHSIHQYSSNGIYEVTLEVTDNDGLTDDISKLVIVGIIPTDISTLTSGWNLKSPPGYDGVNKTDLIILYNDCYYSWSQAVDNVIISDHIFGWSGISYIFADVLYPTEGYWLYAYQPCTLKRVI